MPQLENLSGKRILVVEDEYLIADELSRSLKDLGASVVGPVGWLAQALDLARGAELDGAILDINLHGEMAYDIARALKARSVPFVFATGYHHDVVPALYELSPLIEKPLNPQKVIRTLAQSLG